MRDRHELFADLARRAAKRELDPPRAREEIAHHPKVEAFDALEEERGTMRGRHARDDLRHLVTRAHRHAHATKLSLGLEQRDEGTKISHRAATFAQS